MNFFGLYPGMRMKRWIFLVVLGVIVFGVAFSGQMGYFLRDLRWDVIPQDMMEKAAHQVQSLKSVDFLLLAIALYAIFLGIRRIIRNAVLWYAPALDEGAAQALANRSKLEKGPRIVALGGSTGLPALCSGLKGFSSNLTAVVAVFDGGRVSGRREREFKMDPAADIRNCLVAMADHEPLMAELFQYRDKSGAKAGKNFGELFISALSGVAGDFGQAVNESSQILAIRGQILPVTLENVTLQARFAKSRVERVLLHPDDCKPNEQVIEAINRAQVIVLGPGNLYTSVLPHLLVPGIADAIARANAIKVYVCNLMTQPGETEGYTAADHVQALVEHTGRRLVDYVVVNTEKISDGLLARFTKAGSAPVEFSEQALQRLGVRPVKARLLAEGDLIRHDPIKLGRAIMKLVII